VPPGPPVYLLVFERVPESDDRGVVAQQAEARRLPPDALGILCHLWKEEHQGQDKGISSCAYLGEGRAQEGRGRGGGRAVLYDTCKQYSTVP